MGLKKYVKKMKAGQVQYVKTYSDKEIFTRLLRYLKPYMNDVKLLVFLMIVTSLSQMAYPIGMTLILQAVRDSDMEYLTQIGLALMVIMFINFLAKRAYQYNINKLSQYIMFDLRYELFTHIQTLSLDFYSLMPTGKLMSRLTNDVEAIQSLISSSLIQVVGDIFMVITSFILMMWISWQLSLTIILFLPLFGAIFYFFALKSRFYWAKQRKTISEITRILQEAVSGSKTIKAFVTEDQNIQTFNVANKEDKDVSLAAAKLNAFLQPITQLIMSLGIGIVIFMGSYLVQHGVLDLTLLLGYVILALQFITPVNNIGNFYNTAQQALASGDRAMLILDTEPTVRNIENAEELPEVKGTIEYQNVYFEYEENVPVLKNVNLKTKPNQRTALVGFTGAGKSTFISLLSRFYDPQKGKILIDGIDIKEATLESVRSQMGIVLQDTFLFSGTVMNNIRYGNLEATDDEIVAASKKVGAYTFIMNLPDGFETNVRERGSLLSVGQRQLIAFARALIADPRILILDEATSSVDPYTELKIQEALEVLLDNRNSFIIAHRLSTILNSDTICVMEKGEIIQRGSHEELIAMGGLYKHLYEMQFKKPKDKETIDNLGS
jgi:ATP-binding cassette, subfamily B, multidrug efflux pump